MRERLGRIVLAGMLAFSGFAGIACDREDRADVREGVKDAEQGVDDADTDGQDD